MTPTQTTTQDCARTHGAWHVCRRRIWQLHTNAPTHVAVGAATVALASSTASHVGPTLATPVWRVVALDEMMNGMAVTDLEKAFRGGVVGAALALWGRHPHVVCMQAVRDRSWFRTFLIDSTPQKEGVSRIL